MADAGVAGMPSSGPRRGFQVLSFDGGGILVIFTATQLACLEKDVGRPVLGRFDLVVGTSTAGIIAAGLAARMTAYKIAEPYIQETRTILPGPARLQSARQLIGPKYRPDGLTTLPAGCSGIGSSNRAECR